MKAARKLRRQSLIEEEPDEPASPAGDDPEIPAFGAEEPSDGPPTSDVPADKKPAEPEPTEPTLDQPAEPPAEDDLLEEPAP